MQSGTLTWAPFRSMSKSHVFVLRRATATKISPLRFSGTACSLRARPAPGRLSRRRLRLAQMQFSRMLRGCEFQWCPEGPSNLFHGDFTYRANFQMTSVNVVTMNCRV